ncbi:MAG: MarR family transcriptional regulator [Burkholderiaceae bacterium]
MSEEELGAEWRDVEIVSKFLNITPRRVQQLAADGVIPRGERGKYHLVGAIRGYIKFLQERIEARAGEDGGLHDERTRLARLQSEDLELRLAERRGQLVNATQYESAVGYAVMATRAELLTRDDKLKAELDALYGIDIDLSILNEHTRSALSQLARYDAGGAGVDAPRVGAVRAAGGDDDHGLGEDAPALVGEGNRDPGNL